MNLGAAMTFIPFHSSMRWTILLLIMAVLGAGEAPPKNEPPPTKPDDSPAFSKAGKADAKLAFARQEKAVDAPQATGADPVLVGCYLWNGRADQNYKPFFQWELRFKGGSATASDCKLRVITLGPQRQVLVTGAWKKLNPVPARGVLECDYLLNCPLPPAFRIELAWEGGSDQFLGWDRSMVPLSLNALKDTALLACVGGIADMDKKVGAIVATWSLWNVGGQPANEGSTVTVRFHDDAGKVVHSEVWRQPKGEIIPAHSAKDRRILVRKPVPTNVLSFSVSMPAGAGALAGPTNVDGVIVSHLEQQGLVLKARIRNGGAADLTGLVVTLGLQGQKDAKLATVDMPAVDLKVGAEREVQVTLDKPIAWTGFDMQWRTSGGAPPPSNSKPAADGTIPSLAVKGLEMVDITSKAGAKGLTIRGRLNNVSGKKLEKLELIFSVHGADAAVPVPVSVDELDAAQGMNLEFLAKGLDRLSGLEMTWSAGSKP